VCFVNELELYLLVLCAEQQLNCLCGELFTSRYFYSEDQLVVFQRAWKVVRKFCPLCGNIQEIPLSPRRIKDKFHLYFQSFHKLQISVKIYP